MTSIKNYGHVRSVDDLAKLARAVGEDSRPIGFDIETGYHGPDRNGQSLMMASGAFVVGFSFTIETSWARYVPLRHDNAENLDVDAVWEIMTPLLDVSRARRVIAHNAKFEMRHMRNEGIELGIYSDTILEAYALSEWKLVGLKPLVKDMFGHTMTELIDLFPDLTKDKEDCLRFNTLDLTPEVVAYACEDALWCLACHERNYPKVMETRRFMMNLEHEILPVLCDMEDRGVSVDWPAMEAAWLDSERFVPYFAQQVREGFERVTGQSQGMLNLNSIPQIRKLLYEDMGLPVGRLTKGGKSGIGKPSTDEIALTAFAKKYPPVKMLLQLREIENLQGRMEMWLEKPKGAKPKMSRVVPIRGLDGRVHASYNQVVVGSGRFSADNPPIQQCPKDWFWCWGSARTAYEKAIGADASESAARQAARDIASMPDEIWEGNFRTFLTAGEGTYLLGFDYSQIELRAIAGLAKEQSLLDAFERGDDVHSLTAARMLGKRLEDVDPEYDRPIGKTMNFALIYQMGVRSLADRLNITLDRAKELYDAYFSGFPAIMTWVENAKMTGKQQGYTVSYFGRKWTIWELIDSVSPAMYAKGERMAVNGPVQGWAADYMKIAMARIRRSLIDAGLWGSKVWLLMNQHDALVFEVSEELSPRAVMDLLMPQVEFPIEGFPAIESDWEMGYRWGSGMSKIKKGATFAQIDGRWTVVGTTPTVSQDPPATPVTTNVVKLPSTNGAKATTIVVSVSDMPTSDQFSSFASFVQDRPGPNHVLLRTPQGEVTLPVTTSVGLDDSGRIGVTLPGASVTYRPEDVDIAKLVAGSGL